MPAQITETAGRRFHAPGLAQKGLASMQGEGTYEVDENGCWLWRAGWLTENGYRLAWMKGRPVRVHRWMYERHVGPIPKGLVIDHLCRNRECVNPEHLEPVTQQENILRGVGASAKHAAKTHCLRGHELNGDNVYARPGKNERECRTCQRIRLDLAAEATPLSPPQENADLTKAESGALRWFEARGVGDLSGASFIGYYMERSGLVSAAPGRQRAWALAGGTMLSRLRRKGVVVVTGYVWGTPQYRIVDKEEAA